MPKDFQTIKSDIEAHLSKSGRRYYSDFYIGITDNAEIRMFKEHNVPRERTWWIYRTAANPDIACEAKDYFLEKGMRGTKGNGDGRSVMVYCYAVSPTTVD